MNLARLIACSLAIRSLVSIAQPAAPPADADGPAVDGLYELTIQTTMPHLDEALRYATTRERRCLTRDALARAFPVLTHVALQDCTLVPGAQEDRSALHALRCTAGHGTSGEARWTFDERRIAGTLNVKLGGKNMTFSQRVSGVRVGACPDAPG